MGKLSKIVRDEKSPSRKPVIEHAPGKNGKQTCKLMTNLSHQVKMANKVRAKYQRLIASTSKSNGSESAVTTSVTGGNPKKSEKSNAAAFAAIINNTTKSLTQDIGADPVATQVHDADMDELVSMFSKLSITDSDDAVTNKEEETTLSVADQLPAYGSRQNVDINAQEQIGSVLQQIRLEMAVSQDLSRSLGSASLTGSRKRRSTCDDDDVSGDSACVVLSDEEYLAKRRKFSNKERNFA